MITKEAEYIKQFFMVLGRKDKLDFLLSSPLNDKEVELLDKRFIKGLSLKDCAEELCLEVNSVSKKQAKAIKKLYLYIKNP